MRAAVRPLAEGRRAQVTLERPLVVVGADVGHQGVLVGEGGRAPVAPVGPLAAVPPHVGGQVVLHEEGRVALGALVGPHPGVPLEVGQQVGLLREALVAVLAPEGLHLAVGVQVVGQVVGPAEARPAQLADEGPLVRVRPVVGRQRGLVHEGLAAEPALVLLDADVDLPVLAAARRRLERLLANLALPRPRAQLAASLGRVEGGWVGHFDVRTSA